MSRYVLRPSKVAKRRRFALGRTYYYCCFYPFPAARTYLPLDTRLPPAGRHPTARRITRWRGRWWCCRPAPPSSCVVTGGAKYRYRNYIVPTTCSRLGCRRYGSLMYPCVELERKKLTATQWRRNEVNMERPRSSTCYCPYVEVPYVAIRVSVFCLVH